MAEILLISVFTFLAFYGLLHIIMEIVSGISCKNRDDLCNAYTVITVKDRETDVERIIRAAAWRQLRTSSSDDVPEIYAVDLDSNDGTYEILQRLEPEYKFLKVFRKDEYMDLLTEPT